MVEANKLMVKKVDNAVNTTFICKVKNKHGARSSHITTFVIRESLPPAGSHAGHAETSTVHALEWHHTQKHTHVSHAGIWFDLRAVGDGWRALSGFTSDFVFIFSFPCRLSFGRNGQSWFDLPCVPPPTPRVGANTTELSPRCQTGNSDFQSKANVSLQF